MYSLSIRTRSLFLATILVFSVFSFGRPALGQGITTGGSFGLFF